LKRSIAVILLVLLADQVLKVWVKLNFFYESSVSLLGTKGYLHFIENPGMAFGMVFGGERGKLLLTLFRIVAVIAIGYSLWRMSQQRAKTGLLISVALIFAGALGNIIDSTFYGLLFSQSTPYQKAILFPPEGGYGSLFHGSVVDMFYFPLWQGQFPQWFPIWGGRSFEFFEPVFNVADAAITAGVILFILMQRKGKEADAVEAGPTRTEAPEDLPAAQGGAM